MQDAVISMAILVVIWRCGVCTRARNGWAALAMAATNIFGAATLG